MAIAFASSLDQVGPFGRTVEDVALMLQVIAGADPMDSTAVATPVPDYRAELGRGIEGLRIGIPTEYFIDGMSPEVESAVRAAIATLERLGARTAPVSLPPNRYGSPRTTWSRPRRLLEPPVDGSSRPRAQAARDLIDSTPRRARGFGEEVKRHHAAPCAVRGLYERTTPRPEVRTLVGRDSKSLRRWI